LRNSEATKQTPLKYWQNSVGSAKAKYGEASPEYVDALFQIAQHHVDQKQTREAKAAFNIALEQTTRLTPTGVRHQVRAQLLKYWGDVQEGASEFEQARDAFTNALASYRQLGLSFADGYVHALFRLSYALGRLGEVSEARRVDDEAVEFATHNGRSISSAAEQLFRIGHGRWDDGEVEGLELMRQALATLESILGPGHDKVRINLIVFALGLYKAGRIDEARAAIERSATIMRSVSLSGEMSDGDLANLATFAEIAGDLDGALDFARRAVSIQTEAGLSLATHKAHLGGILLRLGKLDDAEREFREGIQSASREQLQSEEAVDGLGDVALARGQYSAALRSYEDAESIRRGRKGAPKEVRRGIRFAKVYLGLQRFDEALELIRPMLADTTQQFERNLKQPSVDVLHSLSEMRTIASVNVAAALALVSEQSSRSQELAEEAFMAAQWNTLSTAALAVMRGTGRLAAGSGRVRELAASYRDTFDARRAVEESLNKQLLLPIEQRNEHLIETLQSKLAALDKTFQAQTRRLQLEFPEYEEFTTPRPLNVRELRSVIADDEIVLVYMDAEEGVFAWAISKDTFAWRKVARSSSEIRQLVAALRCGLDATLWDVAVTSRTCKDALGVLPRMETVTVDGKDQKVQVLPFDLARAHELYRALLLPVGDMIRGKRLLIVPSGTITSLPFNVLVTEPSKTAIPEALAQYRDVAWLPQRTAIIVLPSISSLKALRQFAKKSHASKPYLGIGNPLLDGPEDDPVFGADYKKSAELARTKRCSAQQQIAIPQRPRPVRSIASLYRGAQVNIEQIRSQVALPETADELCQVAQRLGVPDSEILLGANATEAHVKDLSEQGRLAEYSIVHFATHGALAGRVLGSAEPGLILTPPPKGTSDPKALERDDGFLTASEIATLKLDADWVVLSACNTAGAQGENAEALSGMARAFFYAGARALLVSHWEVGSDAAVKLTTGAFAELKAHPEIGRAEAMRISMRDLIDKGSLPEAHPSQWAPFVVVGEGAAVK
jgi:CHAT domain-containing protein